MRFLLQSPQEMKLEIVTKAAGETQRKSGCRNPGGFAMFYWDFNIKHRDLTIFNRGFN